MRLVALLAFVGLLGPIARAQQDSPDRMRGFSEKGAVRQHAHEQAFLAIPKPEKARRWLKTLTEKPRMAGTEGMRRAAEWARERLREFGWEVELDEYHVLLSTPESIEVRLVTPTEVLFSLREQGEPTDKDTFEQDAASGFNAYSASGEVRAPVVYANRASEADFDRLEALGIDVKGHIVLARYGGMFRGIKVRNAAERGAVGILLYTDPADDGFFRGDAYPRGPWRPASGIQRGSILDMTIHPGDPLTPGWAAREDAQRIQPSEALTMPAIPCVPISAKEATPILEALAGDNVPSGWQGALPFTYHLGPGPAEVEMKVKMKEELRPIANVIARLEGAEYPEQQVLLGGHLDSWTHGAVDNGSGSTALIEAARALGEAARQGHRPRRTIVVALWDGEEFGIIGSTEFVEAHLEELREHAIAYLNLDAAISGPTFGGSGSPSLKNVLRTATQRVEEPLSGDTVYDRWSGGRGEPRLGDLGSGSDYAAFVQHAGIPALSFGFGGPNGNYHSMYDTFEWMQRFGDPTFHFHTTAARLVGVVALRLANADLLPIDGALAVRRVATESEKLKAAHPTIDVDTVIREANAVGDLIGQRQGRIEQRLLDGAVEAAELAAINGALRRIEQHFTSDAGLFGRPWYRHLVFAPDPKLGYGGQTLPGLREAAETADADRVRVEVDRLRSALRRIRQDFEQLGSS